MLVGNGYWALARGNRAPSRYLSKGLQSCGIDQLRLRALNMLSWPHDFTTSSNESLDNWVG